MSRSNPRQNNSAFKGLQYRAQIPAFLAKMQRAAAGGGGRSPSPTEDGAVIVGGSRRSASPPRRGADGRVREAVPERPRDGRWAGGSDDEGEKRKGKAKAVEGETDEWEERWGGGMDGDGPQIVVLKEGKHLSEAEVMAAKRGETQTTTTTDSSSLEEFRTTLPSTKPSKPSNSYTSSASKSAALAQSLSAKRKASSAPTNEDPVKAAKLKKKELKKEKEKKGLLSFDDE